MLCGFRYMPFDGNRWNDKKFVSYADMLRTIQAKYPLERLQVPADSSASATLCHVMGGRLEPTCRTVLVGCAQDHPNDTSKSWHVPGFKGRFACMRAYSHRVCCSLRARWLHYLDERTFLRFLQPVTDDSRWQFEGAPVSGVPQDSSCFLCGVCRFVCLVRRKSVYEMPCGKASATSSSSESCRADCVLSLALLISAFAGKSLAWRFSARRLGTLACLRSPSRRTGQ